MKKFIKFMNNKTNLFSNLNLAFFFVFLFVPYCAYESGYYSIFWQILKLIDLCINYGQSYFKVVEQLVTISVLGLIIVVSHVVSYSLRKYRITLAVPSLVTFIIMAIAFNPLDILSVAPFYVVLNPTGHLSFGFYIAMFVFLFYAFYCISYLILIKSPSRYEIISEGELETIKRKEFEQKERILKRQIEELKIITETKSRIEILETELENIKRLKKDD